MSEGDLDNDSEQIDAEESDLTNSDVCTKYREAAKIANLALRGLTLQATVGTRVLDLCKFGDDVIVRKCATIYTKKVKGKIVERGIAFPTCVSINECVCHNSPFESDQDQQVIGVGDVVKFDVGCHIDGYIAVAAHTIFAGVPMTPDIPITGRKADILQAAHTALELATKLLQPGNTNSQVTSALKRVTDAYDVNMIFGLLTHRMKRFVIDGNKVIIMRDHIDQKVQSESFELNEVYALDIALSTGDGKPRESLAKTTIFKRAVDKNYRLKMRASRSLYNEVNAKYPALPFGLRMFEDERQARMGVVECLKHDLLNAYPVLYERPGSLTVHVKSTVLILPSGPTRVTGLLVFEPNTVVSDKVLDSDLATLMATSSKRKKKKGKKQASFAVP